jgi:hypothetical protein
VPDTATRNVGSVHPIDATAYDTPNTNIDRTVRLPPPRSSLGSLTSGSNPASIATPRASRAMPMTSEIQGTFS